VLVFFALLPSQLLPKSLYRMENRFFLEPIDFTDDIATPQVKSLLGNQVSKNIADKPFPDIDSCQIAIIGVEESRYTVNNPISSGGPDRVRQFLYQLHEGPFKLEIADLGNIKQGHTVEDTYVALTEVLVELLENNVVPVVIGGSQDLTYACYKAYEKLKRIINIVAVDKQFDLGNEENNLNSESYLKKIIVQQPNYLFNYSNIGYQSYLVEQSAIKLMENMFFDVCRLGISRADLPEIEPLIRNADLMSFDIGAIRASDAPGHAQAGPNGFFGDEACQIARYAGLSEKLSAIGFFEYNPKYDPRGLTAHLIAQMIWYFLEGFFNRKNEDPAENADDFIKYYVPVNSTDEGIVFYRSKKSDRWWMEIGAKLNLKNEYRRHNLIPCSLRDYNTASENDIPDRWWKAYQKLM
jgi:formiminoglutamase